MLIEIEEDSGCRGTENDEASAMCIDQARSTLFVITHFFSIRCMRRVFIWIIVLCVVFFVEFYNLLEHYKTRSKVNRNGN